MLSYYYYYDVYLIPWLYNVYPLIEKWIASSAVVVSTHVVTRLYIYQLMEWGTWSIVSAHVVSDKVLQYRFVKLHADINPM